MIENGQPFSTTPEYSPSFSFAGEGGEGEAPPEGLGDEATPSEDEEEDSVDSSASQPSSPAQPNPLEPETEILLR